MLIFGLGLTEAHWKQIFRSIQKPLGEQKVTARLLTQSEIQPQSILSTCDHISKTPPALFLLTPQGFTAFTDCLFFLSQLQMRISGYPTQYGLILESPQKDLYPFIAYHPEVTLVNKMRLTVSDPSLLVHQPIRRFPRIRIDSVALRVEYQGSHDSMVNQAIEEIPSNRLIPFNHLQTVYTEKGPQSPDAWLTDFLQEQDQSAVKEQVKGFLKEEQGCYLFPGIPVDRIETMTLGDIRIHYMLAYEQLSLRSVSFKRMVEALKESKPAPSREAQTASPSSLVRCLGNIRIVNQLMDMLLTQQGLSGIRFISELPPGTHALESSLVWVQLTEFKEVVLQGDRLDLHKAIQEMLQPLTFFIEIDQLKIHPGFSTDALPRIELEQQRDFLTKREKHIFRNQQLAQNKLILLEQESVILHSASGVAEKLMQCLINSMPWEDAMAHPHQLQSTQVLIFCQDQGQAYELNHELPHVSKKLWLNPFEYTDADQLCHLPIESVQQYADAGTIVIDGPAMKHWESLHNQVFDRHQEVSQDLVRQQDILEQTQTAEADLRHKQAELALRWFYLSLKTMLDQHYPDLIRAIRKLQGI